MASEPETPPDRIAFYGSRGEYGFLSNFYPARITLADRTWPTSEHYFQGQKFAGTPHEVEVRRATTPRVAATLGRDRRRPLRADWEMVKEDVMLAALRAKFTQHPTLRARLLATGTAELVEHTANDRYWADGGDGGLNRLGVLLMQVREELRGEE
ncbi:MAG TPA: NADAR family protein [Ktedonobacterales bacterium]